MLTITAGFAETTSSSLSAAYEATDQRDQSALLHFPDGKPIKVKALEGVVDAHRHNKRAPFNVRRDVHFASLIDKERRDQFYSLVSDNAERLGSPNDVEFASLSTGGYAALLVGPWQRERGPVGLTREEASLAYSPLVIDSLVVPDTDDRSLLRLALPATSILPTLDVKCLMYGRLVWESPEGLITFQRLYNAFDAHRHDGDSPYNAYRNVPMFAIVSRPAKNFFLDRGFAQIREYLNRPESHMFEEIKEIHPARIITDQGILMPLVGDWHYDGNLLLGKTSAEALYGRDRLFTSLSPWHNCDPFMDAKDYSLLQGIRNTRPND